MTVPAGSFTLTPEDTGSGIRAAPQRPSVQSSSPFDQTADMQPGPFGIGPDACVAQQRVRDDSSTVDLEGRDILLRYISNLRECLDGNGGDRIRNARLWADGLAQAVEGGAWCPFSAEEADMLVSLASWQVRQFDRPGASHPWTVLLTKADMVAEALR